MLNASWKACNETEEGEPTHIDAIISNPPSFVGPHLAEKLWCPLYLSFTMPWSPTSEFASPFATPLISKNSHSTNYYSYSALDRLIWSGMKDLVNNWREKVLHIAPIRTVNFSGHLLVQKREIPFLYSFSEYFIPKPSDWGSHIHITGFWFIERSQWSPDESLQRFLDAGEPPVFVGFGSVVMNNSEEFASTLVEGIKKAKVRAIIQSGWSHLAKNDEDCSSIYYIGKAPHDALFPYCSAVVHHGGAGTTSAGIRAGKPTLIIPFFGLFIIIAVYRLTLPR